MNFEPLLERHVDSGCDITELHHVDGNPMEMYLIKTSLLIKLIETRNETGYTCMSDVVNDIHHHYSICHYEYNGIAVMIDSIQSYFSTSMKLLNSDIWKQLFLKEQPIFTKVKDEPPTRYMKYAEVKNAMIANGCFINGTIENSIISRGVRIGKGQ